MRAIAFYPSSEKEHSSQLEGYTVEAGEDTKVAMGRFPMLMLSHGNTAPRWPYMTWPRHWLARDSWWWR